MWLGRNDKDVLDAILLRNGHILAAWKMENLVIFGIFLVGLCSYRGPLASLMVILGCQDTGWLGGSERDVLDAILLRNGVIPAPLGMDEGKCG